MSSGGFRTIRGVLLGSTSGAELLAAVGTLASVVLALGALVVSGLAFRTQARQLRNLHEDRRRRLLGPSKLGASLSPLR